MAGRFDEFRSRQLRSRAVPFLLAVYGLCGLFGMLVCAGIAFAWQALGFGEIQVNPFLPWLVIGGLLIPIAYTRGWKNSQADRGEEWTLDDRFHEYSSLAYFILWGVYILATLVAMGVAGGSAVLVCWALGFGKKMVLDVAMALAGMLAGSVIIPLAYRRGWRDARTDRVGSVRQPTRGGCS